MTPDGEVVFHFLDVGENPPGGAIVTYRLTEAAVRSTVLQLRGIDTTAEFIQRQRRLIESSEG